MLMRVETPRVIAASLSSPLLIPSCLPTSALLAFMPLIQTWTPAFASAVPFDIYFSSKFLNGLCSSFSLMSLFNHGLLLRVAQRNLLAAADSPPFPAIPFCIFFFILLWELVTLTYPNICSLHCFYQPSHLHPTHKRVKTT